MKLGLGYAVSPKAEMIGSFTWARADAEELSVGNVAGFDLRSQFSNYRDWGLEGGIRWHFAPDAGVNPYIAGVVGARWVDSMPATFSVPAAGVVLRDVPFYDDSVVTNVRRRLRRAVQGRAGRPAGRRGRPALDRRPLRPRRSGRNRVRESERFEQPLDAAHHGNAHVQVLTRIASRSPIATSLDHHQ